MTAYKHAPHEEHNTPLHLLTLPIDNHTVTLLCGKKDVNLASLGRLMRAPSLLKVPTSDGNYKIAIAEKDLIENADPSLSLRLTMALSMLLLIAQSGEKVTTNNIETAARVAKDTVEQTRKKIMRVTSTGETIPLMQEALPELENSRVFMPAITVDDKASGDTACETLHLSEEGLSYYNRMVGKDSFFLNKIKAKFPELALRTNKTTRNIFTIEGEKEKVKAARGALIRFGHYLYQHRYESPEMVDLALSVALGEKQPDALIPQDSPAAKNLVKVMKRASSVHGVKFTLADLHLNLVTPRTDNQQNYVDHLNDPSVPFIFCVGPAGVGKTRLALQEGLKIMRDYARGESDIPLKKLVICKPLTTAGRDLGIIPGGYEKKVEEWFKPMFRELVEILSPPSQNNGENNAQLGLETLQQLKSLGMIEAFPIEFMRGETFKNAFVILDEMQNATRDQAETVITRIGVDSQLIMTASPSQRDRKDPVDGRWLPVPNLFSIDKDGIFYLDHKGKRLALGYYNDYGTFQKSESPSKGPQSILPYNGFSEALIALAELDHFGVCALTTRDCQRHPDLKSILENYELIKTPDGLSTDAIPVGRGAFDFEEARVIREARLAKIHQQNYG